MTKEFFKLILVTVVAMIIVSCGDSGTTPPNRSGNSGGTSANKSAEYPLLPAALADAEFEMIDGSKSKISDRKGKVVLANLWATWCGPCRMEMPHLVELHEKYNDKGFTVLGLDIGNNEGQPERVEDIQRFAAGMKLNYELARVSRDVVAKFNNISKFNGVPQSYLIDREGRIRGVFLGGGGDVISKMKQTVASVMSE